MNFLRWLGGFIILFWLMGLIFKIGGVLMNSLLIFATIVFLLDVFFNKRRSA